jgi:hypothetical protein
MRRRHRSQRRVLLPTQGGSAPHSGSSARREEYEAYLQSKTWKELRRKVLKRDGFMCRGCRGRAVAVHHRRYPRVLGEERLEWLYAICEECHLKIHGLVRAGRGLGAATSQVLNERIVRLDDDWRLSPEATRARALAKRGRWKGPRAAKPSRVRQRPLHVKAETKKIKMLRDANEQLHEQQRRVREQRREADEQEAIRIEVAAYVSEETKWGTGGWGRAKRRTK